MSMYCEYCGSPMPDGAKFCTKCGSEQDVPTIKYSPQGGLPQGGQPQGGQPQGSSLQGKSVGGQLVSNQRQQVNLHPGGAQPGRVTPPGTGAGAQPGRVTPPGTGAGAQPGRVTPPGTGAGAQPGRIIPPGTGAGVQSGRVVPPGTGVGAQPGRVMPPGTGTGAQPGRVTPPGMGNGVQPGRVTPSGAGGGMPPEQKKGSHPEKIMIPLAISLAVIAVIFLLVVISLTSGGNEEKPVAAATTEAAKQETEAEDRSDAKEAAAEDHSDAKETEAENRSYVQETTAADRSYLQETVAATTAPVETTHAVTPGEVQYYLFNTPQNLNGLQKVNVSNAGSTSTIYQKGYQNGPEMAIDGNQVTSWQEGVSGSGIGETIYYKLDRRYQIAAITFKLGNWRNDNYFYWNNRPRTVKITVGDFVTDVTFPADKVEYTVTLNPAYPADYIQFQIEDIYKGSKYDDTCIAEIGMYGTPEQ